jgi:hypothetical protein
VPVHLDEYIALLAIEAPVEQITHDVTYRIPHQLACDRDAPIVSSETEEGARLLARMQADRMPDGVREMGFTDPTHLWAPWCVVLESDEIASIAFIARLSADGAEATGKLAGKLAGKWSARLLARALRRSRGQATCWFQAAPDRAQTGRYAP